ncbi:11439_t:CDS:2 [Ambispora leptoticha]|uniref:11439_t:CDS:1 n=1 Tax=Ambispora leptoticha TaxID=144679 RepID=A0A9N9AU77_9GLOM|nr:11439_t:CDS:2 [Ambispora leptoticha]
MSGIKGEQNIYDDVGLLNTDERIILNVGGVKYETYRSTLTAYPDTLLGTMFQQRNQQLLHPANGNEYFFDRNGKIFHYIMEFYRTGQILWRPPPETNPLPSINPNNPSNHHNNYNSNNAITTSSLATTVNNGEKLKTTLMNSVTMTQSHSSSSSTPANTLSSSSFEAVSLTELELELTYFQIPVPENRIELAHKAGGELLDEFAFAIEDLIYAAIAKLIDRIAITFYRDGSPMECPFAIAGDEKIRQFSVNGYCIINYFCEDLKKYLESVFPRMLLKLDWGVNYKSLTMSMSYLFARKEIQKHSKIGRLIADANNNNNHHDSSNGGAAAFATPTSMSIGIAAQSLDSNDPSGSGRSSSANESPIEEESYLAPGARIMHLMAILSA